MLFPRSSVEDFRVQYNNRRSQDLVVMQLGQFGPMRFLPSELDSGHCEIMEWHRRTRFLFFVEDLANNTPLIEQCGYFAACRIILQYALHEIIISDIFNVK
uniref:Uncharacterized protein n=1 Tax=Photinus pyralis TaxID=7054 RepID=A0A1Y1LUX2_PHOPY